ncbi:MAG: CpaD family pilus assembly lipoprotein [Holosporales bacterium]
MLRMHNQAFLKVSAVVMMISLALSGCNRRVGTRPNWQPEVKFEQKVISLNQGRSGLGLNQNEFEEIVTFVQSKTSERSAVYVRLESSDLAWIERQGSQSVEQLRARLEKVGLPRHRFEPKVQYVQGDAGHRIILERYRVTPPGPCAWDELMERYSSPNGDHNFGCTTAANLAAMVAEPRDLYRSEVKRDFDAQRLVKVVKDYRSNEVKLPSSTALNSLATTSGGSGAGSTKRFNGVIGAAGTADTAAASSAATSPLDGVTP